MEEETNEFNFEEIESEEIDKETDTASYKINTYGADFIIQTLVSKIKDKEIVIPTWQRRYVWNQTKASKLIESFLLGLPVPQIFLYRDEESQNLLVIDGQQRLKSIFFFINGKFEEEQIPFYLRNVHPQWEGKTFETLSEPDKKRLKNSILRATIFEQTDPKDNSSIFEIFERLNTGGMVLYPQEIRNCVIRGNVNKFLRELNEYKSWRLLLNKPSPDSRMRDVEMILRFLALLEDWKNYKKPMKEFLNDFMRRKKNIDNGEKERCSEIFKKTMDTIYENIGQGAFKIKAGINIAAFDSISIAISNIINKSPKNIRDNYDKLRKNNAYLDAISKSTTDSDRVSSRIKIAIETFSK